MADPASIRYNNPGAMWGGAHAKRWGATDDLVLHDGQSNHIAVFPTRVQGAAAQFDLWRRNYAGMTLADAIKKWSGGNSSSAYMFFLEKNAGIASEEMITAGLLASARGLALMKAQAQWEAGRPYPMSDAEWKAAQAMVFSPRIAPVSAPPAPQPQAPSVKPHVTAAATVAVGTAAAAQASNGWEIALIAVAVIAVVSAVYFFTHRSKS